MLRGQATIADAVGGPVWPLVTCALGFVMGYLVSPVDSPLLPATVLAILAFVGIGLTALSFIPPALARTLFRVLMYLVFWMMGFTGSLFAFYVPPRFRRV